MKNVLKINNLTTVMNIKEGSFRYVEQVSEEGIGVRYGGVISCMIEAKCYYKADGTQEINDGDVLYYYQEYDTTSHFEPSITTQLLVGILTVQKCTKENYQYSFVAYDNIQKLNADFSQTLFADESSYPKSLSTFLSDLSTFCTAKGVNLLTSTLNCYSYASGININYFYYSGITARDVIAYLADICMQYVYCTPTGDVVFSDFQGEPRTGYTFWDDSAAYIIAPTDQVTYVDAHNNPLYPVFYKQNGLSIGGYYFANIDDLQIYSQSGDFVYRQSAYPLSDITNPYVIYENLVANAIGSNDGWWISAVDTGYWNLHDLISNQNVVPFEVHLFPFRCPFNAGQILYNIEDAKGNRFQSVIMKLELTDSEVVLSCSGPEYYYTDRSKNNTLGETTTALGVEAAGKVSKTGDTMTGGLAITGIGTASANGLVLQDLVYGENNLPSSARQDYVLTAVDKDGVPLGYIRSYLNENNRRGMSIFGRNLVNGSSVVNGLNLFVNADGSRLVTFSDAAAWMSALGLGTNGVLPITIPQGGTGATTVNGIKENIGLGTLKSSQHTISANSSTDIPLSDSTRGIIIVSGANVNIRDAAIFNTSSTGAVTHSRLLNTSGLTVTNGTNKVTIANTTSTTAFALVLYY